MARPFDRGAEMTAVASIRCTEKDKQDLKNAALKEGLSIGCFVRRLLAREGIITLDQSNVA